MNQNAIEEGCTEIIEVGAADDFDDNGCVQHYIGDFYCDLVNYRPECEFDGGDCDDVEFVSTESNVKATYTEATTIRDSPDFNTVEPDCKFS